MIAFVCDRLGYDFRYSLSCDKIDRPGWKPQVGFEEGLQKTIDWYKGNQSCTMFSDTGAAPELRRQSPMHLMQGNQRGLCLTDVRGMQLVPIRSLDWAGFDGC